MNRLPKHITLKHLNAFAMVAQESSFTQAAVRMFQTQSSITTLVHQLETALDVRLFERSSRKVGLTPIGRDLLPRVMRLLTDFDGVLEDVLRYGGQSFGKLRISAAPSAITELIAPAAAAFATQYPGVRLYLRDDNSGRIQRQVLASDVDFGITSRWADSQGLQFDPFVDDSFGVLYRFDDEQVIPCNEGYVRWKSLAVCKSVGVVDETGILALLRARADLPANAVTPFYEASSTTSQAALVAQGMGVAFMPALAAQRVLEPRLRFALLRAPTLIRNICVVKRADVPLTEIASAFESNLRATIAALVLPPGCAQRDAD